MKGHRGRPNRGMPFRHLAKPANGGALRPTLRALLVLTLAIGAFGGVLAYTVVRRGLSAHEEPSRVEEVLARAMRRLATPAAVREQRNPVKDTDAVLDQALEHYADHCASCHATAKWTIAEYRHPSAASQSCAQCHQAPPSHYMMHFKMISMSVARVEVAEVNQCFLCHQTTSWNDIKGAGFYKHH